MYKDGMKLKLKAEGEVSHYWVLRKIYNFLGTYMAELERHNHPDGSAYLQARLGKLPKKAVVI